jgi:hypothetical protein
MHKLHRIRRLSNQREKGDVGQITLVPFGFPAKICPVDDFGEIT